MIWLAPAARISSARAMVRTPPPTRHDSDPAICRTRSRLSPVPIAASRSMTCTLGHFSNRFTQRNTSSSLMRETLALHELDDGAVFEIDGRNQHMF